MQVDCTKCTHSYKGSCTIADCNYEAIISIQASTGDKHTVWTFNRLFTENVGPIDDHRELYKRAYKIYYGYSVDEAEVPKYTIQRSRIARSHWNGVPNIQAEVSKLPKNIIGRIITHDAEV